MVQMEEGEPCLDHPSDVTGFSSVSTRPSDIVRRCIVMLLVVFVLVLAVIFSFIIGQCVTSMSGHPFLLPKMDNMTSSQSHSTSSQSYSTSSSIPSTTFSSTITPFARLIKLERNTTLMEVHPPFHDEFTLEGVHRAEDLWWGDTPLTTLPTSIRPLHYDLFVDITQFREEQLVTGNVSIHVECTSNGTQEIVLHAGEGLVVHRTALASQDRNMNIVSMKMDVGRKVIRLILEESLSIGRYILRMEYTTRICTHPGGGVSCHFETTNNTRRAVSFTTKFEPIHARAFFPCWDDPAIKATFQLKVKHDVHMQVLSNTVAEGKRKKGEGGKEKRREGRGREREGGKIHREKRTKKDTVTTFKKTPIMSTYILSLAAGTSMSCEGCAGDWESVEVAAKPVRLTLRCLPDDTAGAQFAIKFIPKMFNEFQKDLEVAYPLSKLDFVAVRSFSVGAMENWGLIIFDRRNLIVDSSLLDTPNMTIDRFFDEYKIGQVIAHEIAHQWFGNLVTMRDWSELWLNEGFASFFVTHALTALYPRLTKHEYYTRLAQLLRIQAGTERLPLVRALPREGDVEAAFHATHLYTKGAVLLEMVRSLLSDDDFYGGIRRYLRRHSFGVVGREELWKALPAYAAHGPNNEMLSHNMESWLTNEGFPEVTIARNYDTHLVKVSQRLARENNHRIYLYDQDPRHAAQIPWISSKKRKKRGKFESTEFDDSLFEKPTTKERRKKHRKRESSLWDIPFSYMFGSEGSLPGQVIREFWMHNETVSFVDVEIPSAIPILANPEWAFPYRVNYDNNNWRMLAEQLHQSHLATPERSRMQLLVDGEFFLSNSAYPHLYIYLLGYLQHESSLGVALIGLDGIYRIIDQFKGSTVHPKIISYLKESVIHIDSLLLSSQNSTETAAMWLVEPARLSRLYQLRCVMDIPSCDSYYQARQWMEVSSSIGDIHRHNTAVCHHIFVAGGKREMAHLESQLRVRSMEWITAIQLAACARDATVTRLAARAIVDTKNAAVFATVLQSDFTLHYNSVFRMALWDAIAELPESDKRFLFSTEDAAVQPGSKIILHSIRTEDELQRVRRVLPSWGRVAVHLEYIARRIAWQERVAHDVFGHFFSSQDRS